MRRRLNVLYEITKTSIKLQNEGSFFGMVWYLLGPLLLFAILFFVFSHRLGGGIEQYPLYLLLGIICWNFFSTATGRSMNVVLANAGIIRALPIPAGTLVLSIVLHALISHTIELGIFFAVLVALGIPILPLHFVLFLCVLFLNVVFSLGMSFILAGMFLFVRDLNQIWSVLMRAWWFATPIFYAPMESGPGAKFSMYNPMYYVIHLSRELLIYGRIPESVLFITFAAFAAGFLAMGYSVFLRLRPKFVELL